MRTTFQHTLAGLGTGMALLESSLALYNTRPLEVECFILTISALGLFWEVKRKKKTDKDVFLFVFFLRARVLGLGGEGERDS